MGSLANTSALNPAVRVTAKKKLAIRRADIGPDSVDRIQRQDVPEKVQSRRKPSRGAFPSARFFGGPARHHRTQTHGLPVSQTTERPKQMLSTSQSSRCAFNPGQERVLSPGQACAWVQIGQVSVPFWHAFPRSPASDMTVFGMDHISFRWAVSP
jgi:hypothetical protein